jgi:transcription elongation GreA/GreB family factor
MAIEIKKNILEKCIELVQEKIHRLTNELDQLNAAYGEETKSSAGDKYETGREMINQEKQKLSARLADAIKMMRTLEQIDPSKRYDKVKFGSLVQTNYGWYFISAALGAIKDVGQSVFAVSAVSPIGAQLIGKHREDQFEINGLKQKILDLH